MSVYRRVSRYPHGSICGTYSDHPRAITHRGASQGWLSPASCRSFDRLLMSIDTHSLFSSHPHALTMTFTLRTLPPSPSDWAALIQNFYRSFNRLCPDTLSIYVTEMQRRAVPHAHLIVFFNAPPPPSSQIIAIWLRVASAYGAQAPAQWVVPATSERGFLDYQSKHLSKGARNYQRCRDSYPPSWRARGALGSAWGRRGDWSPYLVAPVVSVYSASDPDDAVHYYNARRQARNVLRSTVKSDLTKRMNSWQNSPLSDLFPHPRYALSDPHIRLTRHQRALCSSICSLSRLVQYLRRTPKSVFRRVLAEPLTERDVSRGWDPPTKALAVSRSLSVSVRVWDYPHAPFARLRSALNP